MLSEKLDKKGIRDPTYPAIFSWPKRIPHVGSLSLVPPNLMYCGSSALRNRGLVVLSKHSVI